MSRHTIIPKTSASETDAFTWNSHSKLTGHQAEMSPPPSAPQAQWHGRKGKTISNMMVRIGTVIIV